MLMLAAEKKQKTRYTLLESTITIYQTIKKKKQVFFMINLA